MNTGTLLTRIATSSRLSELLDWPLDFSISGRQEDAGFSLRPAMSRQVVARDGAGGMFALLGEGTQEDRPVLYASSEGQAGLIAPTLAQALQVMIALPYWRDCLKFSGGGRLEEMWRAVPYLERELHEDEPDIEDVQRELFEGLGLAVPTAPLGSLHYSLIGPPKDFKVIAEDGTAFVSLFGRFVVGDNPMWKAAPPAA